MEDGSSLPLWGLIILFFLLWLNGILYGFAAALQNLSENDVEKKAEEGDQKSIRLLKLIRQPSRYVNAIPLMVMASGVSVGAFFMPWAARVFHPYIKHVPVLILLVAVGILLLASLGILTFRRVGTYSSEKYAYRYLEIVSTACSFLYPLTLLTTRLARLVAAAFGIDRNQEEKAMSEEKIISIVDEAHEKGVIQESEAEMIQNIIYFNETEAHDIMTHRKDVTAFDQEVLLREMVDIMLEEGYSRYPVYKEEPDNVIGVVHYKDALKFITKNPWARFKPLKELPGLLRDVTLIPETRSIGDLFQFMQAKKIHMAVVVDEYGQAAGVITMEDILEEIVGDILDEYDEDQVTFRLLKDNSMIIQGLAPLEDVEEKLGIEFKASEFETLNGYLTSVLGHIPTEKDLDKVIHVGGYTFKILSLGNKTIGRVKAEKIKNEIKGEKETCQDIQNSQI